MGHIRCKRVIETLRAVINFMLLSHIFYFSPRHHFISDLFHHYLALLQNPSLESGITTRRGSNASSRTSTPSGATSRSPVCSPLSSSARGRRAQPPPPTTTTLEKRLSSSLSSSRQRIQTDNGNIRDGRDRGKENRTEVMCLKQRRSPSQFQLSFVLQFLFMMVCG